MKKDLILTEFLLNKLNEFNRIFQPIMEYAKDETFFSGGYISYINESEEIFIYGNNWEYSSIEREKSLSNLISNISDTSILLKNDQLLVDTILRNNPINFTFISIQRLSVTEKNNYFTLCLFEQGSDNSINISKRKKLAEIFTNILIHIVNSESDSESLEKSIALKNALEEAKEATLTKSRFLASMSHDLRTPLNTIIGYSELIQDEISDTSQDSVMDDLKVINSAGQYLLNMINNLIDMANIEVGQMNIFPDPFNVKDLISDLTGYMDYQLNKNRNSLMIKIEENLQPIISDEAKIKSCLFNLLINANKILNSGIMNLNVSSSILNNENWFHFEIVLNGVTLSNTEIENIFTPLAETKSSHEKKYGGMGIGLAIVKEFSNMLGGDVRVLSKDNNTVFSLLIPSSGKPDPTNNESSKDDFNKQIQNPAKMVFIIDDDLHVRGLLSNYLSKEGYSVFACANGLEAIPSIKALKPFVITLDIMLPDIEGWELLKIIKEDEEIKNIPVIVLTSMLDKEKALSIKADRFMNKPIHKEKFLTTIREIYNENSTR